MSNKGASEYPLVPHLTKIAKKKRMQLTGTCHPKFFLQIGL